MRVPLTRWQRILGPVQSPIESIFLDALCAGAFDNGYRVGKYPIATDLIAVRPQQRVGRYRADFVIAFRFFGAEIDIVAECDGHDFHEKTKLQASHDKRRDRFMTSQGYRLMRFTGAELHADASRCAVEVLALIIDFQTAAINAASRKQVVR